MKGEGKKVPVSLGYANGWGSKTPEIVLECEKLGHRQYSKNEGRCLNRYGCEICGYYYLIDSSD
jgi:hypothetical protein